MPTPKNKKKSTRRRPATPNLKVSSSSPPHRHRTADPASPPETPSSSPLAARKISLKPRHQLPLDELQGFTNPWGDDPNIRPVGHGHQFSYRPSLGPEQLSPRSASMSSDAEDEGEDEDEDNDMPVAADAFHRGEGVPKQKPSTTAEESEDAEVDFHRQSSDASGSHNDDLFFIQTSITTVEWVVEEVDPMDSDCEGLDVLHPTEIESTPSRPQTRQQDHRHDLDTGMEQGMENLHCSNEVSSDEASDNDAPDDEGSEGEGSEDESSDEADSDADAAAAAAAFYRAQLEIKRRRRVSMTSSFGKRTHSEISDSDDEDGGGGGDVNEVGSSARGMRKRMHRTSLLFQDPPEPRIDEQDEPDSSEEEFPAGTSLARELPYWEIIEADLS